MAKNLSILDFFKTFPDDDSCLEHLMLRRFGNPLAYPKCGKVRMLRQAEETPSHGENAFRAKQNTASKVVLCHVLVQHLPSRRSRERSCNASWVLPTRQRGA